MAKQAAPPEQEPASPSAPAEEPAADVFEAVLRVIRDLAPIEKGQRNKEQGFNFRGVDDILAALKPLLARHGVFFVPDVLERRDDQRTTGRGGTMYVVLLHVRFTFHGPNASSFQASAWGEGTDMGDKATNKAMTGAMKYMLGQVFAIAASGQADADAEAPPESRPRGEKPKLATDEQKVTLMASAQRQGLDLAPIIARAGLESLDDPKFTEELADKWLKQFAEREADLQSGTAPEPEPEAAAEQPVDEQGWATEETGELVTDETLKRLIERAGAASVDLATIEHLEKVEDAAKILESHARQHIVRLDRMIADSVAKAAAEKAEPPKQETMVP